jgi:hypothetical protein
MRDERKPSGRSRQGQGRAVIAIAVNPTPGVKGDGLEAALLGWRGRLSAERSGGLGMSRCCISMRMPSSFIHPSP